MSKRTSPGDLRSWDDAPDLDHLVVDKRSGKRATLAKAHRRNRRYGKRLLDTQLRAPEAFEEDADF